MTSKLRFLSLTSLILVALIATPIWAQVQSPDRPDNVDQVVDELASLAGKSQDDTEARHEKSKYAVYEDLVRRVYLKLSLLNKVANLKRAHDEKRPYKTEGDLKFILTNFQIGPIEEILDEPLKNYITKPGGNSLSLVHTLVRGPHKDEQVMYQASWRYQNYQGSVVESWDSVTVGDVLALTRQPGIEYRLYTAYEVTVFLEEKQRTYRAMLLSDQRSQQSASKPNILFCDNITGGSDLFTVYEEKRRPAGSRFRPSPEAETVDNWPEETTASLLAAPDSCPGGYNTMSGDLNPFNNPFGQPICCSSGIPTDCCYPGSFGVSLAPGCYSGPSYGGESGGGGSSNACKAGKWVGDYIPITKSDSKEHYTGDHAITGGYQASCSWGADCSVLCKISALTPKAEESGDVGIFYSHIYSTASDHSSSQTSAVGREPPTCGAVDAMAVKGCYFGICSALKLSVKWSVTGAEISASEGIWNDSVGLPNNCAKTAP